MTNLNLEDLRDEKLFELAEKLEAELESRGAFKSPAPEKGNQKFLDFDLDDSVDTDSIGPIVDGIIEANRSPVKPEYILIKLNSLGGDMTQALRLVDVISVSEVPIVTLALGEICSAAFVIFVTGHLRVVSRYSTFMAHNVSMSAKELSASPGDLKAHVHGFEMVEKFMVEILVENSSLTEKEVRKKIITPVDVWLTSKQMLEYEFADQFLHEIPGVLTGEYAESDSDVETVAAQVEAEVIEFPREEKQA